MSELTALLMGGRGWRPQGGGGCKGEGKEAEEVGHHAIGNSNCGQ